MARRWLKSKFGREFYTRILPGGFCVEVWEMSGDWKLVARYNGGEPSDAPLCLKVVIAPSRPAAIQRFWKWFKPFQKAVASVRVEKNA